MLIQKDFKHIIISILLVTLLCCFTSAFAKTDTTTDTTSNASTVNNGEYAACANPMTAYATFAKLCTAFPALQLSDAPAGAIDVSYNIINAEPQTSQILFTLDGHTYNYRAAVAATAEIADDQEYINGLYIDFDHDVDQEDIAKGKKLPFTLPTSFTFDFEVEYNDKTPETSMTWYVPEAKTQYSLFSETAGMPGMALLNVAALLQPIK